MLKVIKYEGLPSRMFLGARAWPDSKIIPSVLTLVWLIVPSLERFNCNFSARMGNDPVPKTYFCYF